MNVKNVLLSLGLILVIHFIPTIFLIKGQFIDALHVYCIAWHVRFTTVNLKAWSDQECVRYSSFEINYFKLCFLYKFYCAFLLLIDWLIALSTFQARKTKISFVLLIRFRFKVYSFKFGMPHFCWNYNKTVPKIQQFTFEENQLIKNYNYQMKRQGFLYLRSMFKG